MWEATFDLIVSISTVGFWEAHLKNKIVRFLVLLIAFAIGICASSIIKLLGSHHSTSLVVQNDEVPTRDRSQEIFNALMPNGVWADASNWNLLNAPK
jgi:hypothetical protein